MIDLASLLILSSAVEINGPPIKKWPGVKANKSDGSSDIGETGLEIKQVRSWLKAKIYAGGSVFVEKCFETFHPSFPWDEPPRESLMAIGISHGFFDCSHEVSRK